MAGFTLRPKLPMPESFKNSNFLLNEYGDLFFSLSVQMSNNLIFLKTENGQLPLEICVTDMYSWNHIDILRNYWVIHVQLAPAPKQAWIPPDFSSKFRFLLPNNQLVKFDKNLSTGSFLACERQTFLLAHRRWGTSTVRRLVLFRMSDLN